jgi:hypothetical protein
MMNNLSPNRERLSDERLNDLYESRLRDKMNDIDDIALPEILRLVKVGKLVSTPAPYKQSIPWTVTQKSRLMESLLLDIPISSLVVCCTSARVPDEVIDGEQRLLATTDFLSNNFKLEGLEIWKELNGTKYQELPCKIKEGLDISRLKVTRILIDRPNYGFNAKVIKQTTYKRLNDWRIT